MTALARSARPCTAVLLYWYMYLLKLSANRCISTPTNKKSVTMAAQLSHFNLVQDGFVDPYSRAVAVGPLHDAV